MILRNLPQTQRFLVQMGSKTVLRIAFSPVVDKRVFAPLMIKIYSSWQQTEQPQFSRSTKAMNVNEPSVQ